MKDARTDPAPRTGLLTNEAGTALVMAILASLLLLVFAISFSVLANLEARVGINDYRERQAYLVAEAGLEAVRSALREVELNYTKQLGNTYSCPAGSATTGAACSCTTGANGLAAPQVLCSTDHLRPVSTGPFTVRVDNDVEEPVAAVDANGHAILTALGQTAGGGRSQVRVKVTKDDPWKHVCSSDQAEADCANYQGDNPCTPQGVSMTPCKVGDPHAPKTFPALPAPTIIGIPAVGDGRYGCIPNWAAAWAAENPGVLPVQVIGNAVPTESYFDMALSINATGLRAQNWIPPAPTFPAVPLPGRNRAAYCPVADGGVTCWDGVLFPGNSPNTLGCGLVIDTDWTTPPAGVKYINGAQPLPTLAGEASSANKVVVYVTGKVNTGNNTHIMGTLIVHGDTDATSQDVQFSPNSCLNRFSAGNDCGAPMGPPGSTVFSDNPRLGYPLALVVHHPGIGAGAPPPQNTIAHVSAVGVAISGIIFSSGSVEANPITIDGGIVAYGVELQGSSAVAYNLAYGAAAPPPGFTMPPAANSAEFMLSTWLHCRQTETDDTFANNATLPTCN